MTESENNKIFAYLQSHGIDISEDNTLGIDNEIQYFKKGAKFHITPQFIFRLSKDTFTFEEAVKINKIDNNFNSRFEDVFVVTKRIINTSRKYDTAFLEAMNTRTKEKHLILKSREGLEDTSTFYLLLYI